MKYVESIVSLLNGVGNVNRTSKTRQKLKSAITNMSLVEPLEQRQLMSASFFDNAISLGNLKAHSHVVKAGLVGGTSSDTVYEIDVTTPITLNVALRGLKQSDSLSVMFSDGTVIASISTSGGSGAVSTPLSAGTYYVDVSHGDFGAKGGAHAKKPPAGINKFSIALTAGKATGTPATDQPDFGAFSGSNTPVEPVANGTYTAPNTKYYDFSSNPLFAPGGPVANDIVQGGCGDCYFLATLSQVARYDPGLIEQDIVQTGADTYKVMFLNKGQPVWEQVDGTLPAVETNGQYSLDYEQLGTDNCIWACLMEKAFCYFRKQGNISYKAIEGGFPDEALEDFGATNIVTAGKAGDGATYTLNNTNDLINEINTWQQQGLPIMLNTQAEGYTTYLIGGHVYSVIGVSGSNIELRNPWGYDPVNPTDLPSSGGTISDGGYIPLPASEVLGDMVAIWTGNLPVVNPTPTPTPTPNPTPPATATVSGVVYNDLNNDSTDDQGDPGIAAVMIYATTDVNAAQYTTGDLTATTDANGNYTLSGLTAGSTWYIYEVTPAGYSDTDNGNGYNAAATAGATFTCDFGNTAVNPNPNPNPGSNTASVTGVVYNDLQDDQNDDPGEPGISGVTVYATTNDHSQYSSGDLSAVSDTNGNFTINGLQPGVTYYVYEVTPSGYANSSGKGAGYYTPQLSAGQTDTGYDFGNLQTNPNPNPSNQTLNIQPTQYSDMNEVGGVLGNNSAMLNDGTIADVYLMTAANSGQTSISAWGSAFNFNAEIEVVDFTTGGTVADVSTAAAGGSNLATAQFQATAGDQYEVLIASANNAGAYTMYYFNTQMNTPEQLTSAYFNAGGNVNANIITAANIAPISGTIFAALPDSFGDSPVQITDQTNSVNGYLGADSFTLRDGTLVDAWTATAGTSTFTTISVSSGAGGFIPEVEVREFAPDGTQTNTWNMGNANSTTATVGFQTNAGYTYQVLIASSDNSTGAYSLNYDPNVMSTPTQELPPGS